jgi:hypothetical protein
MAAQRGLLGNELVVAEAPPNGHADKSRGEGAGTTTRRRRRPPIAEKGKGRNLKIPDSVFRRLELEALRRGWDKSKLATHILNQVLPPDIKIVVGDGSAAE